MNVQYKYRCRPGYNSDDLLLEFFLEGHDKEFISELLTALKDLKIKVHFLQNVSLHGVTLYKMVTEEAEFRLTFDDNLDCAFIESSECQSEIKHIDHILMTSRHFKKEDVNFENYRTA